MKKNKKIFISSLMLFALLLLLVGVTYTALTYINKSDANTINIGRISMSYSEPSNALELINALPMSDEEGLAQTNYFEFTVSSNATTNANDDIGVTIPYEVNISDIAIDNDKTILPKDKIKVVLTKVTDGLEEQVMEPTLISDLSSSTLNTGSIKVYDTKNVHKNNNGTITTRYRLRAWIDKSFELDNTLTYQYKFRVNVNSNTSPLSLLKVNKIMLEVWEPNRTVISNSKDNILRLANEEDGRWVEVLDNRTLTKDDRIRITFIYNNSIKGVAPTLSLKFGESVATGTVSNGTIVDNKLSYEYTVTKQDNGKLNINELTGGSIKNEVDNTPVVLTKQEKESLKVNAETVIVPLQLENIKTEVYKNNTWEQVTTNTTVSKDDKVKITFNYNKNISGTVPTLTLNVGGVASKGVISTGVLGIKSIAYQYTVNKEDNGKITINNLTGGSIKDEDEQGLPGLTDANKNTIPLNAETTPTFSETLASNVVTSGDGIYKTTDTNNGKASYYYKGNVTNNYVKLTEKTGDALYRIVRVNEDGSLRIIRQEGINNNATYQFNPTRDNYKYMYYSNSNVENGIMKHVNDWYASTIEGTALDNKVVESNFCEQAKVRYTTNYTSGNAEMVIASKDYKPSLKCEIDGNGKGPLKMKVGLITEDEVMLTGIPLYYNGITKAEYNKNTYLDMGSGTWYFWTMSPAGFGNSTASARLVSYAGTADTSNVSNHGRVRPVFSLSADVLMRGKGTSAEPFEPISD